MNSCSVHTYTQTYIYQSLVWADSVAGIRRRFVCRFYSKKLFFYNSFFFCKFCKNIKPSFNAKSEKELLPERCCVVHRALMSKWLSLRVTGLWSVVGSGFREWRWTLEEPVNDHWHSMEQMNASRLLMVNIGACCRRFCSPHLKKTHMDGYKLIRIPVFVYANYNQSDCTFGKWEIWPLCNEHQKT